MPAARTLQATKGLKPQQWLFVQALVEGMNQTQAYIHVYKPESVNGAGASASQLLKNPKIQAVYEQEMALLNHESRFTMEAVEKIRHEIATDPDARNSDRLTACRDHTKTMGWDRDNRQAGPQKGDTINMLFVQADPGQANQAIDV